MGKLEIFPITEKNIWEEYVLGHNPQTFLQSWNWGETNKYQGKKIFRLGVIKNKKLFGVFMVIVENAKRGRHLLVPGGPVLDWENKKLIFLVKNYLVKLAKKEQAVFIRIRPDITDTPDNRKIVRQLGFRPSPMHLHAENTWILEIDKSDNELLYGMRKNTRYLVRKSENSGLKLVKSKDSEYSSVLKKLQDETAARHKFIGFPERLFKAQLDTFAKDDQAILYMVKYGEEILAAAIIIFYGQYAYYHHSASVSRYPEIPFSYYLQWEIIKDARKRGCKYYNFWGIAPDDNPNHRFAGVTIFKKGFGGIRLDWIHAQDYPLSISYLATYIFENFRKIIRHL